MITKAAVFAVVLLGTINCINASVRGAPYEEFDEAVPQTMKTQKKKIMRREKKADPEVSLMVEEGMQGLDASSAEEEEAEESDMAVQMKAMQEQMRTMQEQMEALQEMQEQRQELQEAMTEDLVKSEVHLKEEGQRREGMVSFVEFVERLHEKTADVSGLQDLYNKTSFSCQFNPRGLECPEDHWCEYTTSSGQSWVVQKKGSLKEVHTDAMSFIEKSGSSGRLEAVYAVLESCDGPIVVSTFVAQQSDSIKLDSCSSDHFAETIQEAETGDLEVHTDINYETVGDMQCMSANTQDNHHHGDHDRICLRKVNVPEGQDQMMILNDAYNVVLNRSAFVRLLAGQTDVLADTLDGMPCVSKTLSFARAQRPGQTSLSQLKSQDLETVLSRKLSLGGLFTLMAAAGTAFACPPCAGMLMAKAVTTVVVVNGAMACAQHCGGGGGGGPPPGPSPLTVVSAMGSGHFSPSISVR